MHLWFFIFTILYFTTNCDCDNPCLVSSCSINYSVLAGRLSDQNHFLSGMVYVQLHSSDAHHRACVDSVTLWPCYSEVCHGTLPCSALLSAYFQTITLE